jgi:acetylornithine deacetylase/succinyl-diaminopimelate desuccinylase-like protein
MRKTIVEAKSLRNKSTRNFLAAALVCAISLLGYAQDAGHASLNDSVKAYISQHRQEIMREFEEFLAIPNLASDAPNIEKNADALMAMLQKRGLQVQLLRVENAPPVVLAVLPGDPAKHTVTFYAHYDGQPVNKADWKQDPWKPTLVGKAGSASGASIDDPETRIYARSAGDDKNSILELLTALDALRAIHVSPSVNLKFFFEGEEEAGSPHLAAILSRYAPQLDSDLWVICDGPTNQDGEPQLVFGSRGVVTVQITAFGASRPLHSGHYGNWSPNPIVELAHLISRLRTTDAEITIPHFYDSVRPLTASEQAALKNVPNIDQQLKTELALGHTEGHGTLAEQILKPGLNLDRIEGGGSGPNPANAIPSSATAYIDFRLVPRQTPQIVKQLLEDYLRALGYFVVSKAPTVEERAQHARVLQVVWGAGYPPQRTQMEAPVSQAFIAAAKTVTGNSLVLLPTLGGSTPSFEFEQQFKKPVIGVPTANYDDNQHAANENLKLKNLWDGIALFAGVLGQLGSLWK